MTAVAVGIGAIACLTTSCGNATTGAGRSSHSPAAYAQPISTPYPIARVARTWDPRVLKVTLDGLPLPSAWGVCRTSVRFELNEQPLSIGVGVSVISRLLPPFPGCATSARTLSVRLSAPLGRRDVFASGAVTAQGGRFIAVGSRYVECRPPDCDPTYEPVVPDCMHLREAIAGTDMPAHFGMAGPCRMPFAAIVVDIGAGACPVTGTSNPCSGNRLTHQFWYSDGKLWRLVLQGEDATCAGARQVLPKFPVSLCRDAEWRRATSR